MKDSGIPLGAMVYPGWSPCSLAGQIAALQKCALTRTEIFMTEKTLPDARKTAERLRAEGIRPISLHAPFSKEISLSTLDTGRRQASVQKGLAALDAAGEAGTETVILHPADDVRDIPLEGVYAEALTDSLRTLCAAARRKGLRVAVENMPSGELGAKVAEIAKLVQESGIEGLGVCLDTGHANMNRDLIEGVHAAKDRLFALHVHDNDGAKDQHLAVFSGTVDWEAFVTALARAKFRGCFMLETGYLFPTEKNPAPSLEWVERLRRLLAEKMNG